MSAKTINNARGALSSTLGDAVRMGLLADNPCAHVPPLRADRPAIDYLRLAEITAIGKRASHYRPLAQLLIGTGTRISEALALTCNDIDLEYGVIAAALRGSLASPRMAGRGGRFFSRET